MTINTSRRDRLQRLLAELSLQDIAAATSQDLAPEAFAKARSINGWNITYSPKVFIPLTFLCRDRCGYCTFAKAPAHVDSPYMPLEDVLKIAEAGKALGVTEALFTLGERPELRYDEAARWLASRGYRSTVDYVSSACELVLTTTGLLPHANCGALYAHELRQLKPFTASQGMMLETVADVEAHRLSPDKDPSRRLATMEAAGDERIPFTTGLLVGIGDHREDRLEALLEIRESHLRHNHIQEVIIQNFLPKKRTLMASWMPAEDEEFLWTIAAARLILPDSIHLQAPPNLSDNPSRLLQYGIDDFGGISPVTLDHVNPERAWPEITLLAQSVSEQGMSLVPRLAVYPDWSNKSDFLEPLVYPHVLKLSDSVGLSRNDEWYSGADSIPSSATHCGSTTPEVRSILSNYAVGRGFSKNDLTTLFRARDGDFEAIVKLADDVRRDVSGDDVTYVVNRNINYTNVCTFKCRFCAFSKGPRSLNLRGDPYLMTLDDIGDAAQEAAMAGATEVCLQGGIHPKFDGDYYLDVVRAVKSRVPDMHIHAFSALEVFEGARRSQMPLRDYLVQLKESGLKSLPGTAAEILRDDIREILCPDKISTSEWLEVHKTAHEIDLQSNITIMFGAIERIDSWADHLIVTRELASETGGFTEFVPLPFVHMASPIYLQGKARRGPTFREAMLMHAVGRLHYAGVVNNIQASWVKMGVEGTRMLLQAGVNDVGGTLMYENISRAAGAIHGQRMDVDGLKEIVEPLGRPIRQRTTKYEVVS